MQVWRILFAAMILAGCASVCWAAEEKSAHSPAKAIPVILDTDIGSDLDDTWALVMLLKSPQFNVKLITTTDGKAEFRAQQIAKLLTVAKRTDIPIGLGDDKRDTNSPKSELAGYSGKILNDGVGAIIDVIRGSPEPITVISIGPLDTLAAVLDRQPNVASKANFVGMQGSIHTGYGGGAASAEWNVRANIPAARKVFAAPWRQMIITPLDTCGRVVLSGARFQAFKDSRDPCVQAILESCRAAEKKAAINELTTSSVLFDTVAIYLANPGPKPLLKLETLPIVVTNDGFTRIDASGRKIQVATEWKSLEGYYDFLGKTLLEP